MTTEIRFIGWLDTSPVNDTPGSEQNPKSVMSRKLGGTNEVNVFFMHHLLTRFGTTGRNGMVQPKSLMRSHLHAISLQ